jgi:hypothetical protein
MTAICNIPNCGRSCPADEAFCSVHRDTDWKSRALTAERALAELDPDRERRRGETCDYPRCGCDLDAICHIAFDKADAMRLLSEKMDAIEARIVAERERDEALARVREVEGANERLAKLGRAMEAERNQMGERWAQGLIEQLPSTHDGRNSWLLNHGLGAEADGLRTEWHRCHPDHPQFRAVLPPAPPTSPETGNSGMPPTHQDPDHG